MEEILVKIKIRKEKPSDYNQIANVTYSAFHGWKPDNPLVMEPMLVDYVRHTSGFMPDLSLVALVEEEIIGHALFTPFAMTLGGKEVKGAVLGPIAVEPSLQKQGIGGQLLEEGHKLLKEKGFDLALLCGHPEYYPKFGYQKGTFGFTCTTVTSKQSVNAKKTLSERPVAPNDLQWIRSMWPKVHNEDRIALYPGDSLMDWVNHGNTTTASVLVEANEPIAYIRYEVTDSVNVKECLVADGHWNQVLHFLVMKNVDPTKRTVTLALYGDYLKERLDPNIYSIKEDFMVYDAFMVLPLRDGPAKDYCQAFEADKSAIGGISFPPVYDIDE